LDEGVCFRDGEFDLDLDLDCFSEGDTENNEASLQDSFWSTSFVVVGARVDVPVVALTEFSVTVFIFVNDRVLEESSKSSEAGSEFGAVVSDRSEPW